MHGYGYYRGYGQDAPPPPPPPNGNGAPLAPTYDMYIAEKDGVQIVKPAVKPVLDAMFEQTSAVWISDTRIGMTPVSQAERDAANADPAAAKMLKDRSVATWVKAQLSAGRVVFMSKSDLLTYMSAQGVGQLWSLPAGSPDAMAAAKNPMAVVVAGSASGKDWMSYVGGPVGVAVIAGVVVGGGYLLYARSKKSRRRTY
jgi:hypothetical protein